MTKIPEQSIDPSLLARARKILEDVPLVDGHNDLPWEMRDRVRNHLAQIDLRGDTSKFGHPMQTDIPRLRTGRLGAQFWSVYIPVDITGPDAVEMVLEQIDDVYRMAGMYPETFEMAFTADDVTRIHRAGKIASLIGMEGGHSIDNSLGALRMFHRAGARYMTITHNANTDWADSGTDAPRHHGLTSFGRIVIHEMNRLGMLVDLSHTSEETMNDVLDITKAPVIFSHSSSRAICDHPRNVPDSILRRVAENAGVVMVTFVPPFISETARQYSAERQRKKTEINELHIGDPERAKKALNEWMEVHPWPRTTLAEVADHIDHIKAVAGIDHIGIGSDFDGMPGGPAGLEDVSRYPNLFAELLRRGYSEDDLRKIAGLNVLRVFGDAETIARALQKEELPSDARIDEVDTEADQ